MFKMVVKMHKNNFEIQYNFGVVDKRVSSHFWDEGSILSWRNIFILFF